MKDHAQPTATFTKVKVTVAATLSLLCGFGIYLSQSDSSSPSEEKSQLSEQGPSPAFTQNVLKTTPAHQHGPNCGCQTYEKRDIVSTDPRQLSEAQIDTLFELHSGDSLELALPSGKFAVGSVDYRLKEGERVLIQGTLSYPHKGHFYLQKQAAFSDDKSTVVPVVGSLYFTENEVAYKVTSTDDNVLLEEKHISDIVCHGYAGAPEIQAMELDTPQAYPSDHQLPADTPGYQNEVPVLSSLPGSLAVVYLDFDGEKAPHQGWGSNLDAEPFDLSSTRIREIWLEISEEFAPFNINVTTDLQAYLDAPEESRQRCIITKTGQIYPGAGGIAHIGSFDSTGDIPCWSFSTNGSTIAHEIGHTFGLFHDTRANPYDEYYNGHSTSLGHWGAIMGSGAPTTGISHWNKGEYTDAINKQDDLAIIDAKNNVSYRTDDHAQTLAAATPLEIMADNSVDSSGVIETDADFDSFRFTLTSTSSINLNINAASHAPNLDILAELLDSSDTVIASHNPVNSVHATLSATLAAGDYQLRITGVGLGDPTDGISSYGSLGHYKITGSVPNAVQPDRFSIAEHSVLNAPVGTVIPRNNHGANPLSFSITSGNTDGAFAIDPSSGALTVANTSAFDYETLSLGANFPAQYELSVSISDSTTPALNEAIRVVIDITDINEAPIISGDTSFSILEHSATGTVFGQVSVTDVDQNDFGNFSITSGNTGGALAIDQHTGALSIVADIEATSTPVFNLIITVTDTGTPALSDTLAVTVNVTDIASGYTPGSLTAAFFSNISGSNVSNLTGNVKYPNNPDTVTTLTEPRLNAIGNNYGSAIRGYLIPPTTGSYTFWISGDNSAELHLSSNADASNLSRIATVTALTSVDQWDAQSSQQSVAINLTAGLPYFIEILHKESSGDDHVSIAWQGPGISQQAISGHYFAPHAGNYEPRVLGDLTIATNLFDGHVFGTVSVTDINSGDTHGNFQITAGNSAGIFAINSATGALSVVDKSQLTAGQNYNLTVTTTDNGSPALTGNGTVVVRAQSASDYASAKIQAQKYNGIAGQAVHHLTSASKFPDSPDELLSFTSFDIGTNLGDEYGTRVRAYVVPPTTGSYTFYISSNNGGQLFLSTDEDPANKTQIASVTGYTPYNNWTASSSQQSAPVNLVAGQRYYIETLHKEEVAGDLLQAAWSGPGVSDITVIGGSNIQVFSLDPAPTWDAASYTFSASNTDANGTSIGTVSATDSSSETLTYGFLAGNLSGAYAIDPRTGEITIANKLAMSAGANIVTVGVQDNGSAYYPYNFTPVTVTINVSGNNAPVVDSTTFSIAENSLSAISVGSATFTDPDPETWTFSIDSGNEAGHFNLHPTTGAITTATGQLDYEQISSYTLNVRVTDSNGFFGVGAITIHISDIAGDDSDSDGLDDAWEKAQFGNTAAQNATNDPDGDGLTNLEEQNASTDPNSTDSDSDGVNDTLELATHRDPNNDQSIPPTAFHSLIGWWKFDEQSGNIANDFSGIASDATLSNQPTWSNGIIDGALTLDGINDQLVTPAISELQDSIPFMVSIWVKNTSSTGGTIIAQRNSSNTSGQFILKQNPDGTLFFRVSDSTNEQSVSSTVTVNDGQWHNVIVMRTGLYVVIAVDGSSQQVFAPGSGISSLTPQNISVGYDAYLNSDHYDSQIDDLRIYDIRAFPGSTIITLIDEVAQSTAPSVTAASFSIPENSLMGSTVGTIASNYGDLIYSITAGNTGNVFHIHPHTGELTLAGMLDYEVTNSYNLTVQVTNARGATDSATITVSVTDLVNEDSDSDTLNDTWELNHLGSLTSNNQNSDTDGDGYTAFQEMAFGMNPTASEASNAPIRSRLVDESGTEMIEVRFRRPQSYGALNLNYTLRSSSSLLSDSWSDVTGITPTITQDGTNEWLIYTLPKSGEKLFYRCLATPE